MSGQPTTVAVASGPGQALTSIQDPVALMYVSPRCSVATPTAFPTWLKDSVTAAKFTADTPPLATSLAVWSSAKETRDFDSSAAREGSIMDTRACMHSEARKCVAACQYECAALAGCTGQASTVHLRPSGRAGAGHLREGDHRKHGEASHGEQGLAKSAADAGLGMPSPRGDPPAGPAVQGRGHPKEGEGEGAQTQQPRCPLPRGHPFQGVGFKGAAGFKGVVERRALEVHGDAESNDGQDIRAVDPDGTAG